MSQFVGKILIKFGFCEVSMQISLCFCCLIKITLFTHRVLEYSVNLYSSYKTEQANFLILNLQLLYCKVCMHGCCTNQSMNLKVFYFSLQTCFYLSATLLTTSNVFGRIALAIPVYRLVMSVCPDVCLSTFWLKFQVEAKSQHWKGLQT